ncbi:MAG: S-methyl-5-thioribose-1-phosphate isomerase [Acidimicrobiales bacterium]
MRTIDWVDGGVELLDQTLLPDKTVTLRIDDVPTLVEAIRRLAVRGAPNLGVAAAFGVVLARLAHAYDSEEFRAAVESLRRARPTAANLARAADRVRDRAAEGWSVALDEALRIRDEEIAACDSMSAYGADLIEELIERRRLRVLTVCNTGGLAAIDRGTALGVVQSLHERGLLEDVLAMETRPLLQGARLTTWELARMGAPHHLIVDGAGPFLVSRNRADVVVAGADRIAGNGDTANKIGTYSVALAAAHAKIPFVVVAPESTVDLDTASGDDIEIETRGEDEVVAVRGTPLAPAGTPVLNPAFDVTPVALITALVTDRRVVRFERGETLATVPLGALRLPDPVPAR